MKVPFEERFRQFYSLQVSKRSAAWATALALLFLIFVGGALRLHDLGEESFWADEAYTALFVEDHSVRAMLTGKAQDRVNPPLFYIASKPFAHAFATPEVSLRFLSFVAGVLLIPAVFWLTRLVTRDPRAALWVATLSTISPYLIGYSQEARSYALYVLLAVVHIAAFLHLLKKRHTAWLALATLTAILGVYTHYGFWTILAAEVIFITAWFGRRSNWKTAAQLSMPVVVSALAFVPWFLVSTYPKLITSKSSPFWQPPLLWDSLLELLSQTLFTHISSLGGVSMALLGTVVIWTFYSRADNTQKKHLSLLLLCIVVPLLSFTLFGVWLPRYTLFILPLIYVVLAWISARRGMRWLLVVLLLTGVISSFHSLNTYYANFQREQWRQATTEIERTDDGEGKIYLNRQFHRFPLTWYYDGDSQVYLPEKNDVLTTDAFHQDMQKYPWVIVIQVGQNKRSAVLLDSAKQTFGGGKKRSFGNIYLHSFHR